MRCTLSSLSLPERLTGHAIKYVEPVPRAEATGLVSSVYAQVAEEFEIVPPLTIHSVVPEILAGVWCLSREAYVVGRSGRAEREAVAAAVSRSNACPFCVEVHSAMLHAASEHALARSLLTGGGKPESPLVEWALATRSPGAAILANPPFAADAAPQILGTAVAFHFINRMVNVFLEKSPMPVRIRSITLKNAIGRVIGATVGKRIVGIEAKPGLSLTLLPEAELPDEFRWAAPNATVAGALARMAHVIEAKGRTVLPESVRDIVTRRMSTWNGEDVELSGQWVNRTTTSLKTEGEKAAARLALLAALASYQVKATDVDQFRAHYTDQSALVATAAWGSFQAVRRLSSWLASPGRPHGG